MTPASRSRNELARVGLDDRQLHALGEALHNLRGFVLPQQSVVDEDARQPIADRVVHEHRRDRRIDAAAQAADDAPVADLLADARHRLLDERRHRPVAAAAAFAEGEVAQDLEAALGVRHLGMEQQRVQPALDALHRRNRRVRAGGDDVKPGRRGHEVAVAGPDAHLVGQSREQPRFVRASPSRGRTRDAAPAARARRARASSAACRSRCRAPGRRLE